jgi:hypothetical protein
MSTSPLASCVIHRNFNLCPHCVFHGQQALLCRMCEGMPMISRSDGRHFHLLLTDQPMPYPAESGSGPSPQLSLCFWYAHVREPRVTLSAVVILADPPSNLAALYRQIDDVADRLAERLGRAGRIAGMFTFSHGVLSERAY